uniref:Uncharacterized protein n=1 Tax=Romanomermis culicivorax TaxID=13658 RepID=A0A915HFH4_ROMCU
MVDHLFNVGGNTGPPIPFTLLCDQGNVALILKALNDSKICIGPSFFDRCIGNQLDQNSLLSR